MLIGIIFVILSIGIAQTAMSKGRFMDNSLVMKIIGSDLFLYGVRGVIFREEDSQSANTAMKKFPEWFRRWFFREYPPLSYALAGMGLMLGGIIIFISSFQY